MVWFKSVTDWAVQTMGRLSVSLTRLRNEWLISQLVTGWWKPIQTPSHFDLKMILYSHCVWGPLENEIPCFNSWLN